MTHEDRKKLLNFIEDKCIKYGHDQNEYILKNKKGETLRWLFDYKILILNPEMVEILSDDVWEKYQINKFQVAGLELSGSMMSTAIVNQIYQKHKVSINNLIIRKKRKKYDQTSLVEGTYDSSLPVLIMDDVVNSFSTYLSGVAAITLDNPNIKEFFGYFILNMKDKTEDSFETNGILHRYNALFLKQDFLPKMVGNYLKNTKVLLPDVVWKFSSPNPFLPYAIPKSAPVIYKESLLFGSESGIFYSLDTQSGKENWRYDTNTINKKGIISAPCVCQNTVFFGNYSGIVYGLDADSGEVKIKKELCDFIGSSPLIVDNDLFIGTEYKNHPNGAIISLDLDTLERNWTVFVDKYQHGSCIYSEKHNKILVGTNAGDMLSIDRERGEVTEIWKAGGPIKYHGAIYEDLCIFGSFDGGIYFWDFVKNEVKLKVATQDIVYSRPLVYKDKVFVGSADCSFYIIDLKSFEVLSKIYCGEKIHSSPSLINGSIYCGVSNGNILKINPEENKLDSICHLPERITNPIIEKNGKLFIYDYTNTLYCIKDF